ncbi:MAG: D-alanine--D-alanine ligase [Syntrophales bacterium]
MSKKLRVGILFGGKSAEHEASLQSAKNIIAAIDRDRYDILLIGIDKEGRWQIGDSSRPILNPDNPEIISLGRGDNYLALIPGQCDGNLVRVGSQEPVEAVDVVFPVLHGPFGEDGTVQGFLKLAGIPFVGSSVLGSAVGMDKDVMKRLLREEGIPVCNFKTVYAHERGQLIYEQIQTYFGVPFFIKPANLGSSVGVYKVHNADEFTSALYNAFQFDNKVLIEEFVEGREIECAVLGNENPLASVPGEVLPSHEFYSYEAKYLDENGAVLDIPANLSEETVHKVKELSIRAFKAICCEGMARVDCFLKNDGTVLVNELNTIPGFTSISMYPKLWEASGIPYKNLIDRLIELALKRHVEERKLRTSYELV